MKIDVRKILICILAAVLLLSGVQLVISEYEDIRAKKEYEDAFRIANIPAPEETEEPDTTEETPEEEIPSEDVPSTDVPDEPDVPVEPDEPDEPTEPDEPQTSPIPQEVMDVLGDLRLDSLQKVNPDVIGWIYIPDTPISYPLMQGDDNQYYLNYTWQKTPARLGSIYLDYRNSADLSDFHSIIYGHRIDSTTMFSSLRHYSKQSYFEEHPCIYIVTQSGILCYNIYAACEVDSENGHTYRLGLTEEAGKQAYIDYSRKDSVIESNIVPTADDSILTLSTCTAAGRSSSARWVVHAVLQK